ncbi:uncharacterized protein [Typha angustifolia]|uniref:uncharacterized protein isoform X1 n=1 Tax=Typha angustifolia TaxID=59011 RepID=UPI003C2C21D5
MKQQTAANRAAKLPSSTSWGFLWSLNGIRSVQIWCFVVLGLSLFLPCEGKESLASSLDATGSRGDEVAAVKGPGSSPGCYQLRDACADSHSFCFSSASVGFLGKEDGSRKLTQEDGRSSAFKMSNGGVVMCSLVDTESRIDGFHPRDKNVGEENVASCQAPLVPDSWMRMSSGVTTDLDDHSGDSAPARLDGSSSPNLEISPPVLNWGTSGLYSASLAFLTVTNRNNDSVLQVYEPFSTDPQFYAYGSQKLLLVPGESASIAFVFLPRWLGSSLAHLVLQTNFGGFIIQAKGIAVESSYRIKPLVGFNISTHQGLNRNLSIYNPFDDVLYVDEVSVWVSASESANHSVHTVCRLDASHQAIESSFSLGNKEWHSMSSDEFRLPKLDIRPHKQWEVPPQNTKTVFEINLWPHFEGKVFGAICMKLWNSTADRTNTIIIPLELEVHGRAIYKDSTGSVSVSFDSLVACDGRGSIFSLLLRNDGLQLLSILSIIEDTESSKIFEIKYMEGLMLFPGTDTQIALIKFTSFVNSQTIACEIPIKNFVCNLVIETNNSASPFIKIPCQDFANACFKYQTSSNDDSYVGMISQQEKEESVNTRTGSLGSIMEDSLRAKSKPLSAVEADDLLLRNWRSHGTMAEISVLKDHELLFPAVQIGSQFSKWITVHNPSQRSVMMQLLLNSEEIIDQCKSANDLSDHSFSSRSPEIDSTETRFGFSIADSATTEAFVHPSGSASFGPIVFRPSNRCAWSSSALIRNNLSGIEWLPIRAFGGSHSLGLFEGSEPVWKLEFNLDFPINRNMSPLHHTETTSPSCNQQLLKEIYAKNTGDLPLEVKKVRISGTECGSDGFTVQTCNGFSLAPGESVRFLISYQSNFAAATIHRDLELAMTTGIFVVPMKASIPVYMLNLCGKSFFRTVHWKVFVLVFAVAAASIFLLVLIRTIPYSFLVGSEEYYVKPNKSRSTTSEAEKPFLHQSTKASRSVKEQEKPEGDFVKGYPIRQNDALGGPKRMQDKNAIDHQKKNAVSPAISAIRPSDDLGLAGAPQSDNLTIKVVKEKGKRRKKKATGSGLAAKLEVSSSHSGNSTPSSPLSPSASSPKQGWLLSPERTDYSLVRVSEQKNQKRHDAELNMEARLSATEKCYGNNWLSSVKEQLPATPKSSGKPTLLASATFPGRNWHSPGASSPVFLGSCSPIAPHARAPGSTLRKDKTIKREENVVLEKEFTYDIWGDHFADRLLGKQKVALSKVFDASEGDSQSFFAREPQSLMMMPSVQPVSPGHELSPNDVTFPYEMN